VVESGSDAESPTTPIAVLPVKKRTAAAKAKDDTSAEVPTKKRKTATPKTKAAAANGEASTPTPKAKAAAAAATPKSTSKGKPIKVPESYDEFSASDKVLVHLRKEGKGWEEVEKAWTALTGVVPGKDVLRKREAKLRPLAVEWKAGDVSFSFLSLTVLTMLMYSTTGSQACCFQGPSRG